MLILFDSVFKQNSDDTNDQVTASEAGDGADDE
jgi:hypothetical protein